MVAPFNTTHKTVHAARVDLKTVVDLTISLTTFIGTLRDQFDEFEKRAQEVTGTPDYKACGIRKRNRRNENIGASAETVLSARDAFYVETSLLRPTIDNIIVPLKERATSYQNVYTIFMETFPGEIVQFVAFANGRGCMTPADQAKLLCEGGLTDTFPNDHVALRIYLCLMVTRCSGERSFSSPDQE